MKDLKLKLTRSQCLYLGELINIYADSFFKKENNNIDVFCGISLYELREKVKKRYETMETKQKKATITIAVKYRFLIKECSAISVHHDPLILFMHNLIQEQNS
jgi:hypothetical protein